MDTLKIILQIACGLGILNVWLLRFAKETPYRPASAHNLPEEFAAYGLPEKALYAIGGAKVLLACALIAGVWIPEIVVPAAWALAFLMIGAIVMHLKVQDPVKKSVPATTMLLMTLAISLS
ncbi:MAG: DoxX family protein [Verrucomicrobiota bacterium]